MADPPPPPVSMVYGKIPDINVDLDEESNDIVSACYKLIRGIFSFSTLFETGAVEPECLRTFEDQKAYFLGNYSDGFSEHITGEPETVISKYTGLCYVRSRIDNRILSCCVVVYKEYTNLLYVAEVWAVASNPYFQRSGAATFLLSNIHGESYSNEPTYDVRLEVARDSFPYITFYDRLLMYYKLGFQVVSDSICPAVLDNGTLENINLSEIRITYRPDINEPIFLYSNEGVEHESPISDLKRQIPLLYEPATNVYMQLVKDDLHLIQLNATIASLMFLKPRHISSDIPTRFLYTLYHSCYAINPDDHTIISGQLPANVELVIMNTPGFNTSLPSIIPNWDFSQKYLSQFSIDQLNLIFHGIKSDAFGIIPSPMSDLTAYKQAIENNLLFKNNHLPDAQILHFHCYKPGDFFPELELGVAPPSPTSTDFVSLMYGVYDIPKDAPLNEFKKRSRFPYYMKLSNIPTFVNAQDYLPDQKDLIKGPAGFRATDTTLSRLIQEISEALPAGEIARVYVFSCGAVDNVYEPAFRAATDPYLGRIVNIDSTDEYTAVLELIGKTLKTSFGYNLPEFLPCVDFDTNMGGTGAGAGAGAGAGGSNNDGITAAGGAGAGAGAVASTGRRWTIQPGPGAGAGGAGASASSGGRRKWKTRRSTHRKARRSSPKSNRR